MSLTCRTTKRVSLAFSSCIFLECKAQLPSQFSHLWFRSFLKTCSPFPGIEKACLQNQLHILKAVCWVCLYTRGKMETKEGRGRETCPRSFASRAEMDRPPRIPHAQRRPDWGHSRVYGMSIGTGSLIQWQREMCSHDCDAVWHQEKLINFKKAFLYALIKHFLGPF